MKYRIMIAKDKRDNYGTLYQYLVQNIDGVVTPMEFKDALELDVQVEKMLNEDGYAKDDFICVEEIEYDVKSTIVED